MKFFILKLANLFFRVISKIRRVTHISLAIHNGMKVGERTLFVGNCNFGSEPFLVEIGSDCLITDGVRFITHDGSIQVPLIASGEKLADVYSKKSTFDRITIKNNVFIGVGSIILPKTVIGNHCIVAAAAVVKGIFPDGVIIAGNPARIIATVDEYYLKNKDRILFFNESDRKEQIILKVTQ